MLRSRILFGTLAATLLATNISYAGDGCTKPLSCGEYDCGESCRKACRAECEWITVKKKCWEVECKQVCVPPVKVPSFGEIFKSALGMRGTVGVLPTRGGTGCTGCGHQCAEGCQDGSCPRGGCGSNSCLGAGRVRTIRVLKSKTTEVEKMIVKWNVGPSTGGCGKGCAPSVSLQGCAPAFMPAAPVMQPAPSQPAPAAEPAPAPPPVIPARLQRRV